MQLDGAILTGPLYSRVLHKIQRARQTGLTTQIRLLQQPVCLARMCPPMIYHVGLIGNEDGRQKIFEHGPIVYDPMRSMCDQTLVIELPPVCNAIDDIIAFERTLPNQYLPGYRDCRHHVLDLLGYLYPD